MKRSYFKLVYNMQKNDAENGINYVGANWAFQIKTILETHGLGYMWHDQNTESTSFSLIKQRILDNFRQSWYAEINNSSRLSTYSRIKHDFNQEKYLNTINEKKYRIALTKFRTSAHNLEIEKGRHLPVKISRCERICKQCNLKAVESEYHFLLVCPRYNDLRRKYFTQSYWHWPTLTKFDNIMTCKSKKVQLNIGKFISCTPDRNCHTFCLGDKIASHPGVLTQAKCAKKLRKTLK